MFMKKMNLISRVSLGALGLFATGWILSSCNKLDDGTTPQSNVSGMMAFNLATDQNAINITLDGKAISNVPLGFDNFTGSYVAVYSGQRQVVTYNATGSTALATSTASLDTNKYYSAFFAGANGSYRNIVVRDNFDGLSASNGMAYVRYIQAIPDSSATQINVSVGGTPFIDELAGYADVSAFTPVSPGPLTIDVSNGSNIDTTRTFNVEAKRVYTILIVGAPDNSNPARVPQIKYVSNGLLPD